MWIELDGDICYEDSNFKSKILPNSDLAHHPFVESRCGCAARRRILQETAVLHICKVTFMDEREEDAAETALKRNNRRFQSSQEVFLHSLAVHDFDLCRGRLHDSVCEPSWTLHTASGYSVGPSDFCDRRYKWSYTNV